MARITPIDVIKGISGKYGSGSSDYFATNSSSNRIHLAKYINKPVYNPTDEQKAQVEKFGTQQKLAAAWLRENRPTNLKAAKGTREHDGTEAYQLAQALKRQMHLSNVRQIVLKYMSESGVVTLPSSGSSSGSSSSGSSSSGGSSSGGTSGGGTQGGTSGGNTSGGSGGSGNLQDGE